MVGNNRANSTTCVLAGEAAVQTRTGHPGSPGDIERAKLVSSIYRLDVLEMSKDLRSITPEFHGVVGGKAREFVDKVKQVQKHVDASVELFAENTKERRSYENVQNEVDWVENYARDVSIATHFVNVGNSNRDVSMKYLEVLKGNCTRLARAVSRARRIG